MNTLVTLRRSDDAEEAEFGYDASGFLDRAAVLAWAGASAVTVARLWGLGGAQLGPELFPNPEITSLTGINPLTSTSQAPTEDGYLFGFTDTTTNHRFEIAVSGLTVGKVYRYRFRVRTTETTSAFTQAWTMAASVYTAITSPEWKDYDLFLPATATSGVARFYVAVAGSFASPSIELASFSVKEVLRPNAIQTTTANQPPLDLTSNPLRIGAAADTSLVATLPANIADAQIIALQDHGVTYDRRPIPSADPYIVQSVTSFKERVILSPDVSSTEVRNIMLNIKRAWKNPRAVMAYPAIGEAIGGGFYTGAAWDTVTTSPSTLTIGVGNHTLAISGGNSLPLYAGQWVTLAPANNTTQVFMRGAVASVTNDAITVVVDSITGSGSFTNWVIACPWKVILAPKSGGESTVAMQYKTANTAAPSECKTLTNGRAATAAMIAENAAAGSIIYPAADFVRSLNAGQLAGYSDWELPARDWLELMWRNLKPLVNANYLDARPKSNTYVRDGNADDILGEPRGLNRHSVPPGDGYTATIPAQTELAQFQAGGAQAMATAVYFWSSSEYSATYAWYQYYTTSGPGYQYSYFKTNTFRVRAVRREILEAI